MSYVFRQSNENEVLTLTKMSEAAFNSDKEFGGGDGGPTGYADYDFHISHCREGRLFSFLNDDKLVAGAILKMQDNDLYIYRIFVDSTEFHKGYGLALMKAIEERFPAVNRYCLDTPEWNIRTNNFYKKCGYVATGKEHTPDFDLIIYEKAMIQYKEERLGAEEYIEFLKRTDLGSQYPKERFTDRINRLVKNVSVSLTARDNGKIVGVLFGLTDFAYWLYVTDLGVDREYEGRGIGRTLMEKAHQVAGGEKDIAVYLIANEKAIPFYKKLGMKAADDVMCYNKIEWTPFTVE